MSEVNEDHETDTAEPVAAAVVHPVLLEDFIRALSASDRRVEIIHAFYRDEQQRGAVKDLPANFRARFEAFLTQPA